MRRAIKPILIMAGILARMPRAGFDLLEPMFEKVLVMTFAKRLAAHAGGRWTDAQESEMQERIAELVAEAKKRGLTSIRMNVVRSTGQRLSRDIDLARLGRERTLQ